MSRRAAWVLLSVIAGVGPDAGAQGEEQARAALLDDVATVAAPGVPGDVVAFGPGAFVVLADRHGTPVAAAAQAGKGRVLVLGHGGYPGAEAIAEHDTARFLQNSMRWLAGGKRRPRIGCPDDAQTAQVLGQLVLPALHTGRTAEELEQVDVAVLDLGRPLSRARSAELREFVLAGGGLLGVATGWGWQQLNADRVLARDLPGNRLLAPWGLAFGARTSAPEAGGFPVRPPAPLTHAGRAFTALAADSPGAEERSAALGSVAAALAALDDHEPQLMLPLRALMEGTDPAGAKLRIELATQYEARDLRPLAERWEPWLALGPFPRPRSGLGARGPLEERLERFSAGGPGPDLSRTWRGKQGPVAWSWLEQESDGRALDVGSARLDRTLPVPEHGVAYLTRRVVTETAVEHALQVDASGGLRLWVDGELALERDEPPPPGSERIDLVLRLEPGVHHLLVKTSHDEGVWSFRLRPLASQLEIGAIDAAVLRGVEYLVRHQLLDGSWDGYAQYGPGLTAFTLYALLKSGLGPEDPTVRKAWAFVESRRAEHTYSLGSKILAAFAHERGAPTAAMRAMVERMISMQERSGLYSYPVHPDGSRLPDDLSTTLYGALALRAASERGLKVPAAVWSGLIEGTLRCWRGDAKDDPKRGFSYRTRELEPGGRDSGAMTGAGLSVLAIARDGLGGRIDRRVAAEFEAALGGGRHWLEERLVFGENPGHPGWHLFHVYGVERTGALLGEEVLGGVHWYREGARYLVERQRDDGSWEASDHAQRVRDTALALLFLNRATRPGSGPGASAPRAQSSSAEGQAAVLAVVGRGPFELWIAGYGEAARAAHGWGARRTLRVQRVRYLGRREGAAVEVELAAVAARPDAPVQRFETRVELPGPGRWTLRAELELLTPAELEESPPGRATVASGALELTWSGAQDDAVLAYAGEGAASLLRGQALSCAASSQAGPAPGAAADGNQGSFWACSPGDLERRWSVQLERGVGARRLTLSHAVPSLADPGRARAAEVEVWINGDALGRFPMVPDPLRKTVVDLGGRRRVTGVELRLHPAPSGPADRALGIAEVELLPR